MTRQKCAATSPRFCLITSWLRDAGRSLGPGERHYSETRMSSVNLCSHVHLAVHCIIDRLIALRPFVEWWKQATNQLKHICSLSRSHEIVLLVIRCNWISVVFLRILVVCFYRLAASWFRNPAKWITGATRLRNTTGQAIPKSRQVDRQMQRFFPNTTKHQLYTRTSTGKPGEHVRETWVAAGWLIFFF
jgi:hypothetical protein